MTITILWLRILDDVREAYMDGASEEEIRDLLRRMITELHDRLSKQIKQREFLK